MIYYRGTRDIKLKQTAVALGKFEGLHKGHQFLFEELKRYKKEFGYQTVVFTFDFHPSSLFSGIQQPLLYTQDERRSIVGSMGIDVLVEYPFTLETSHMLPEDFVSDVLIKGIDARAIVVGDDFHFGYKRSGDVKFLKDHAREFGFRVDDCEKVCYEDEVISSTRIRDCVVRGDMETAAVMLGRPYSITGVVTAGQANGRTVGMPTANIVPDSLKLLPPEGVYASAVHIENDGDGESSYYGVTNIGRNPTVSDFNDLRVETYIFDFSGDLYGKTISVSLYSRLRGEKKFGDLHELKEQVDRDKKTAIGFFSETGKM